jgi:two-component system, NtrC family, nitrogen regulation response regulator GlnG
MDEVSVREKARILIVDDDQRIVQLLSDCLKHNHTVDIAMNADEALAIVRRQRPDLVLVDILLPGISGLHLLKEFKRIDPTIPAVMMTGSDNVALAAEALEGGAVSFVRKPVDLIHLDRFVTEILTNQSGSGEANWDYPLTQCYGVQGPTMPEKEALLAVLIMERPLCINCIAGRSGLSTAEVLSLLTAIGHSISLTRATDRCHACGETIDVYSLSRRE